MNSVVSIFRVLHEARRTIFTVFVFLFGTFSLSAADDSSPAAMKDMVQSEQAARKAVIDEVSKLMDDANTLMRQQKFFEASRLCVSAKGKLQQLSGPYAELKMKKLNEFNETLKKRWASKLLYDANMAMQQKRYDEAITLAKSLVKINPDEESAANKIIEAANKFKKSDDYKGKTALTTIDPDNAERKEDIDILLNEAKVLYKNREYDKAKTSLEKILIKDPYNVDATFLLDKLYKREYEAGKQRRENETLERMYETEWKWNEAVLPTEAVKPEEKTPQALDSSKSGIFEKLNKIVFDRIEFEDAPILAVVNHLKTRSRQLDPDGVGVNLLLRISDETQKADPRVSMEFDKMPMVEVLKYLCQGTGLKFRVEEQAVLIGDSDIDEMETQYFKVRAELISNIISTSTGASADGEGNSGETSTGEGVTAINIGEVGTESTKKDTTASSEALKKYFIDRGVPFPEGATAAYEKRTGRLIVKNTPENLRKLDDLLRAIDIQKPMVLIEAKFLEISQHDVEELGFDWIFSAYTANPANTSTDPNDYTALKSAVNVADSAKIVRDYAGADNRNNVNRDTTVGTEDRVINNLALLSNVGDAVQYNLALTVYALDQSGRVETLSSPRVIASSGTTATIRMVREYYYPESWNDPEVSISNSTVSYTPAYPEFGDPTDVGIRFEVTPTVFSNNYTVSLELNPQVIAFVDWTTYPCNVIIGNLTTTVDIRMAHLSRRDIVSKIKVFDGETVVLGGMLTGKNYSRKDKYPGLGDIPLAGRLFQSILEDEEKVNLMIFLTCRLMSNDGIPVKRNALRGLPEFNR